MKLEMFIEPEDYVPIPICMWPYESWCNKYCFEFL
jgi:hypothetical protein